MNKVLFLHKGDGWMRGSENALLTLFHGLQKREVSAFLYSNNSALVRMAATKSVFAETHPMPEIMVDRDHVRLQIGLWMRTLLKVCSIIAKNRIQLIYCNGGSTCQIGYYAAKIYNIPVICHIHSHYDWRYILFYRFHLSSKVIFVSKAIQDFIQTKQRFKAESEVVYNGVDTARFQPAAPRDSRLRTSFSIPEEAVVFGQVSSLIDGKGIDVLLRAFQILNVRCPNARLVLVGDGEQRGEFVDLAYKLGINDKVIWAGSRPDPVPFYQHVFDVNVLASRQDAFGLAILEAAACRLPTIGARVGGIPEAIADQQTGLLFDCGNQHMLAMKMAETVQKSESRAQMGRAARLRVLEHFTMDKYCSKIATIIEEQIRKITVTMPRKNSCILNAS